MPHTGPGLWAGWGGEHRAWDVQDPCPGLLRWGRDQVQMTYIAALAALCSQEDGALEPFP